MATAIPVGNLENEVTCPICLEFFKDPVMILGCGHNFCQTCITQYLEGAETDGTCPQCRQTFPQMIVGPNKKLAHFVEIVKSLSVQSAGEARGKVMCNEHGEALKLFCETDQKLICLICRESRLHRAHNVAPMQEASKQYKEQTCIQLEILKEERKKLQEQKERENQKYKDYQEKAEIEMQEILAGYEKLYQFFQEKERLLRVQLRDLEEETDKNHKETITQLSEEISCLNSLIEELEEKYQQQTGDFLQGIKSMLSRCERKQLRMPGEIFSKLNKKLRKLTAQKMALRETLGQFQDDLPSSQKKARWQQHGSYNVVKVTLDPDTAHPCLLLSEDRRSMTQGRNRQNVPDNPERFDPAHYVLGSEGFTLGRHTWEVNVAKVHSWALGVARESVRRKGEIIPSPDRGIWAVRCCMGRLRALTSPTYTPVVLNCTLSKVRVCLDCAGGWVSFLDADAEAALFTFPPASFNGEKIRPLFSVWMTGAALSLCH
ncbi:zinc finger protein RFP-like isoform X1 [Alligator mississippiensis]|uniref:zinc finger protein RFP-like isoform X1 n=1 Tax=Alligator mississippiensis TaxID=8496 RepID=UPI0007114329|nr:zinc finger protein RFP-like isoform X1 [Alligator mississippiensis]